MDILDPLNTSITTEDGDGKVIINGVNIEEQNMESDDEQRVVDHLSPQTLLETPPDEVQYSYRSPEGTVTYGVLKVEDGVDNVPQIVTTAANFANTGVQQVLTSNLNGQLYVISPNDVFVSQSGARAIAPRSTIIEGSPPVNSNIKKAIFLKENNKNYYPILQEDWIINLTDIIIPENVKLIISLGPKFSVDVNHIPLDDLICNIEYIIQNSVVPNKQNTLRNKLVNIITNYKNRRNNKHKDTDLNRMLKETKKFLSNNRDIIITKADKGEKKYNNRDERRRATHNEVERRRRDKINNWILKLSKIIPETSASEISKGNGHYEGQSKGGILAKACQYIQELQDCQQNMELCVKEKKQLTQNYEDVKQRNLILERENKELRDLLKRHGIDTTGETLS
ncbi:hypothetical protein MML48_4g00019260 [Holotrichia oblita]|uniref:Uncharacterized protein n=1 Tax=Holotrichia oblita TaxID=644536 RepID=A0ACB9T8W7_HOLOL|nr:hypothetical protein MML48_4g00019260 [Holotrichia oblita]